jgi:hypothetical protein
MRVYLPLTLPELAEVRDRGLRDPAGFAVTETLRAAHPDEADDEVLEYLAMLLGAAESAARLPDAPERLRRRLVLAADAPDEHVGDDAARGPGAVVVTGVLGFERVAALQVDEPSADPAPPWEERDLLWYAPHEAADLLSEAGLR